MRSLGVLLLLMLPVQALALSCMRPSVELTYEEASASDDVYVVVRGRLTLDARKMPKTNRMNVQQRKLTRVAATLTGQSLGKKGFKVPFEQNITLEVGCVGPWCGSARNGEQILAFLRKSDGKYMLEVPACGGRMFANPRPAMVKAVERCFERGTCR